MNPLLGLDGKPILSPDGKPYYWWDLRTMTVQIPYFDYVEIKTTIIMLCKKNKKLCDSNVSSWDRTLGNLDQVIIQK